MTRKQQDTQSSHERAARAVDELRRQSGVAVTGAAANFSIFPIEFLDENTLTALRAVGAPLRAILTGKRAAYAGLAHTGAGCVQLDASALSLTQLRWLADPVAPEAPLPALAVEPATDMQQSAILLAKHAALLPALLAVETIDLPHASIKLDAADLLHYAQSPQADVIETARAKLPVAGAEDARIVSFREKHGTSVHLALLIGEAKEAPLVRVHSSCVTGDILGSLRCDCGSQLTMAVAQIAASGGGILVYLHQEGRGIGITNKLRAYALQERGVDTYDANLMLGFDEDERDFAVAAAILKYLGAPGVRLLTNNPHKIANLEKHGIRIIERVPLVVETGAHNHAYLDAKAKKSGHLF